MTPLCLKLKTYRPIPLLSTNVGIEPTTSLSEVERAKVFVTLHGRCISGVGAGSILWYKTLDFEANPYSENRSFCSRNKHTQNCSETVVAIITLLEKSFFKSGTSFSVLAICNSILRYFLLIVQFWMCARFDFRFAWILRTCFLLNLKSFIFLTWGFSEWNSWIPSSVI